MSYLGGAFVDAWSSGIEGVPEVQVGKAAFLEGEEYTEAPLYSELPLPSSTTGLHAHLFWASCHRDALVQFTGVGLHVHGRM